MSVSFTVRWSDFVWMYLASWGPRLFAIPGVVLMAIAIPTNPSVPILDYITYFLYGLVLAIALPTATCIGLLWKNGAPGPVGKTVTLRIDDDGISGWPLGEGLDSSWSCVRKANRLRGVTSIPFRNYGTRAAWVPIPDRALTSDQRECLRGLLAKKGLVSAKRR